MKQFSFLFTLLFFSIGTLNAMQTVKLSDEAIMHDLLDNKELEYQIDATINQNNVGFIRYGLDGSEFEIKEISVIPEYRNNPNYKVGSSLFKQCIENLKARNCCQIRWNIIPLDEGITHSQLLEIYRKILAKLSFQENKDYVITPNRKDGYNTVDLFL